MTAAQKGRIFISYRRADSAGYAGRIYDRLSAHFGEDAVFMDVDKIKAGDDFPLALKDALLSCDVLITLIGKQWLSITNPDGKRRLDNLEDFVRIEIATALERKIRVIPVLVDGTNIPNSTELPHNLKPLAQRNAIQVNHHSFNSDILRLVSQLEEKTEKPKIQKIKFEGEVTKSNTEKNTANKFTRYIAKEAKSIWGFITNLTPITIAIIVYVLVLALFAGRLSYAHDKVGTPFTPYPFTPSLLMIAPSSGFYYPDLNAVLFDMMIHPMVFATLTYLYCFVKKDKENLQFPNAKNNHTLWIWGWLIITAILSACVTFSVYDTRYRTYNLQQPLLKVALSATGLSFFGLVTLSSYSLYIAWNLNKTTSRKPSDHNQKKIAKTIIRTLAFVAILLFFEAYVMRKASIFKDVPSDDILWVGTELVSIITVVGLLAGIYTYYTNPKIKEAQRYDN